MFIARKYLGTMQLLGSIFDPFYGKSFHSATSCGLSSVCTITDPLLILFSPLLMESLLSSHPKAHTLSVQLCTRLSVYLQLKPWRKSEIYMGYESGRLNKVGGTCTASGDIRFKFCLWKSGLNHILLGKILNISKITLKLFVLTHDLAPSYLG